MYYLLPYWKARITDTTERAAAFAGIIKTICHFICIRSRYVGYSIRPEQQIKRPEGGTEEGIMEGEERKPEGPPTLALVKRSKERERERERQQEGDEREVLFWKDARWTGGVLAQREHLPSPSL